MSIERINKIRNHRIFKGFYWSRDLPNFQEKNLFYGWNGTGKSTLSNLFRAIEKKKPISEGEVEFLIDGKKVDLAKLKMIDNLPKIRVFNKDFIDENVFTRDGETTPIVFLGEESIKKQKQFEKSKNEKDKKIKEKIQSEIEFDHFKINNAKLIKDMLSSSGGNNYYNNYDKRLYQRKCDELLKLSDAEQDAEILSDYDFNKQKRKKDLTKLPKIDILSFSYPDTKQLTDETVALLKKTINSYIIVSDVTENPRNDQKLEKYSAFIDETQTQSKSIRSSIDYLEKYKMPSRYELYEYLRSDFDARKQEFSDEINKLKKYLKSLLEALEYKQKEPFEPIERSFDLVTGNKEAISDLNLVLKKHNQDTDELEKVINSARVKIEEHFVTLNLTEYRQKKGKIDKLDKAIKGLQTDFNKLESEIKDIKKHLKSVEELNKDIRSYLGRDELAFKIKESGYQLSRNGIPAENLSEGEKTAIAFLYFLTSLEDISFSLKDDIVVIDDPVSSLDSNSLFYAFSFMKEKTKDANQLFILTHNHSFFRQVKNWFKYCKKNERSFYMIEACLINNERTAKIKMLDKFLENYESEYHYLFSLVYKAAQSKTNGSLQQNYYLPNIARRLLEAFLAFRQPSKIGKLQKQLDKIDFDKVKKKRIIRFLHTYSHSGQISEPEYDPSILTETKQILQDLLELIEEGDSGHFTEMEELVK